MTISWGTATVDCLHGSRSDTEDGLPVFEVEIGQLWLGNAGDARAPRALLDSGICAVVDLAWEETPATLPREFISCRIPLVDGDGNSSARLTVAVQTVASLYREAIPTLVSCSAALSRSPAIVAAALSVIRSEAPDRTLESLAALRALEVSPPLWIQLKHLLPTIRFPAQ